MGIACITSVLEHLRASMLPSIFLFPAMSTWKTYVPDGAAIIVYGLHWPGSPGDYVEQGPALWSPISPLQPTDLHWTCDLSEK